MRRSSTVLALAACIAACSSTPPRQPATPRKATAPRVPRERENIGGAGGVVDAEGAQLTIGAGAVKGESTYAIIRVTGADLAGWPRGTMVGYAFEPAGQAFRLPVLLELPVEADGGQAVCQAVTGERTTFSSESISNGVYRLHVTELPARCALYGGDHVEAVDAARARQADVVARQNASHKWAIQSELCNPNLFARPNAGRSLEEPPGLGGCPLGMAAIPGRRVCIDRWEAHVVEVLPDGTFHSWSPYFNPGDMKLRARSAPGATPQAYISQVQAAQACAEAGKRLCADTEWIAACRGSNKTQYPYGNTDTPGACNDRRDRHPAIEYLQSNDVYARLEHPCINQVPNTVALTGAKTACHTPEEVFDMVGNLHEWTADPNGTFRGGYYVESTLNGRGCDYVTTRHDAIYWDYSVGFRCCADLKPERDPGSIRVAPE